MTRALNAGARLPGTPTPMHRWPGAGGVGIAGDSWGDPRGPLVLLQHGGGQTRHAWKGAGETLGAVACKGFYRKLCCESGAANKHQADTEEAKKIHGRIRAASISEIRLGLHPPSGRCVGLVRHKTSRWHLSEAGKASEAKTYPETEPNEALPNDDPASIRNPSPPHPTPAP